MPDANNQLNPKRDTALAALEDYLESPVVPGELSEWCQRIRTAFEVFRDLYVDEIGPAHKRQLAEIRDQDQEMSVHVTKLSDEHEAILLEFERLGSLLQVFVDHVDDHAEGADEIAYPDGTLAKEGRQSLVQEMLAFVIRIRTHEKSLRTWFVEAFQRDRGVAD